MDRGAEYWGNEEEEDEGFYQSPPQLTIPPPEPTGRPNCYHLVISPNSPEGGAHSVQLATILNPAYLRPQVPVIDCSGVPKLTRDGREFLKYLDDLSEVDRCLVSRWTTPSELYNSLSGEHRKLVNGIKSFLVSASPSMSTLLVYHVPQKSHYPGGPSEMDPCVTGCVPHLHAVVAYDESEELTSIPTYKAIVKAANASYFKVRYSTFDPKKFMGRFRRPGYTLMGTNSVRLGRSYRKATLTDIPFPPLKDDDNCVVTSDPYEPTGFAGFPVLNGPSSNLVKRRDPFGEKGDGGPSDVKRSRSDGW